MDCDGYNKSENQMTNNDIKEEWKRRRQDFDETELKAENQLNVLNIYLIFRWFLPFLPVHQKFHHFLRV